MKIYDLVKEILTALPRTRNSDKQLLWEVWDYEVSQKSSYKKESGYLARPDFIVHCTSAESITRARRKVQELHPELRGNREVTKKRKDKESKKGNFVFHEKSGVVSNHHFYDVKVSEDGDTISLDNRYPFVGL